MRLGAAFAALLLSPLSRAAPLVDDFRIPGPSLSLDGDVGDSVSNGVDFDHLITREMILGIIANGAPGTASVTGTIGGGAADFVSASGVSATTEISYREGGVSLSGTGAFRLDFETLDVPITLRNVLQDGAGGHSLRTQTVLPHVGPFSVITEAAEGSVDLDNLVVTSFQMFPLDSGRIRLVRIQSVPEPAPLAFLAGGTLVALRRRRPGLALK